MKIANKHFSFDYQSYKKRLSPVIKTPKTQAYFVLILSFFTMAFFGFLAIRPTLRTIFQLNREIDDSRKLNDQLTKKINALASVQADYELIRGAVPGIYKALPETAEFPVLIFAVEDVARRTQASISALTFDTIELASASARPNIQNEPSVVNFTVTFSGDYDKLVTILTALLNDKRIITYDKVSFGVNNVDRQKSTMSVNLGAKSFYY